MTEPRRSRASAPKASEPQRSNRARAVADIVPDVGRAAFRRFGFVQSSIVSRWAEIVGDRYAAASTPESIRFPQGKRAEGVLTLAVDGAHAPMLQHVAPAIVERVNRFFGYAAVARVVIRQGAAAPRPAPRPQRAEPKPLEGEMGESLRSIGDPELRACLEALGQALEASEGPPLLVRGRIR